MGVAEIGRVNLGFQISNQIDTATMSSASRLMDVRAAHPRSSASRRGRRCKARRRPAAGVDGIQRGQEPSRVSSECGQISEVAQGRGLSSIQR